ncbi:MAG: hypothetical protein ACLR56_03190 [Oscillospiraceae bacterium]
MWTARTAMTKMTAEPSALPGRRNVLITAPCRTKIMLKCGSVFDQMLVPRSSGTAGKYFIIDSCGAVYINGDGEAQAVLISSLQYIEIRNLEIRNPSEYSASRKGVAVYAGGQVSSGVFHEGGVFNHIYLINLDVIDVSCTDGQRFYGGLVFYSRHPKADFI